MVCKGRIILSILLLWILHLSNAQISDLKKDKKFFRKHWKEYANWLEIIHVSDIILLDSYEIKEDHIVVYFKNSTNYQNPEFLSSAWLQTRKQLEESFPISLEKLMILKFAHVMELRPDQVKLEIAGSDQNFFKITAEYKDQVFNVEEKLGEIRGNDNKVIVKVSDLKQMTSVKNISSVADTRQIKNSLKEKMEDLFSQADSKFGNAPQIEIIFESENEFTLVVSNITNQIIQKYFELINLNVEIEQDDDKLEVKYTLFGKYSSGIFVAPRITSSDYQDMYPEYSAEIGVYLERLGQRITQMLVK